MILKKYSKKILSFLLIFYFLFLDSIVQSQWFNHKLHVVGKDGLLDLSDQLTDIKDTNIQLEINDWQCEFELLSLESFRLIKEPNKKKVIQIQESIMATCYPTASPVHQVKFSTSCQNLDGPLEGEWDKKKLKDISSIILKSEFDFVKISLSCG